MRFSALFGSVFKFFFASSKFRLKPGPVKTGPAGSFLRPFT